MRTPLRLAFSALFCAAVYGQPIRLHPDNPHYFLFRGKPLVVVSSGEHYGAVCNPDFDFLRYLDALASDGMNYTRLFSGVYFEPQGAFGIEKNTLAPAAGKALVPWARTTEAGNLGGGAKFDLNRWDAAYFNRLRTFMEEAAKRGIVVELTLFSSVYTDTNWKIHPLNPANHVGGQVVTDRLKVNTLDNGALLSVQESVVRKIVRELAEFDNVVFEIQNEPWSDLTDSAAVNNPYLFPFELKEAGQFWKNRVDLAKLESLEWQKRVAGWIVGEEAGLPNRHLIAQNFCNFHYPVQDVDHNVSVMNFHYAWPDVIGQNYGWNRPVAFDETGFAGSDDATYSAQAWRFMMAGGAVFNNLDYSFTVGHEDGTDRNKAPGGGSATLRKQLRVLKHFLESVDFVLMRPDPACVNKAPGAFAAVLSDPGREYALFVEAAGECRLTLDLPPGTYTAEWMDAFSGAVIKTEEVMCSGKPVEIQGPGTRGRFALRIRAGSR